MKGLVGRRFGNLIVIRFIGSELTRTEKPKRWGYFWQCRCRCGVEIKIGQSQLTGKKVFSCDNCRASIKTEKHSMENIDRGNFPGFLKYFTNNEYLFESIFQTPLSNIRKEWEKLNESR
jgi:hypothetical protein